MNIDPVIVIAGAGVAGLTLACRLQEEGVSVVVVEREQVPGGLARSFEYGKYTFDVGPHRFYSENDAVTGFIKDVLDDDFLTIERKSAIWLYNNYFEWPFAVRSLMKLPLRLLLPAAVDLVTRPAESGASFKDYITARYGRTLYKTFFEPYTEKFLKLPCDRISKDWAVSGIDRAVINSRIRAGSLSDLVRSVFTPAQRLEFLYPRSGGIGVFAEKLADRFLKAGGRLILGTELRGVRMEGRSVAGVYVNGGEIACSLLVWTGAVNDLLRLLGCEERRLDYLSLILYNYTLDDPPPTQHQWCYFGSAGIPFNRVSFPFRFNAKLAPAGKAGMCVEMTCMEGDDDWESPGRAERDVRRALMTTGLVKDESRISGVHIEKIRNVYPVYHVGYADEVGKAAKDVADAAGNVRLLGRTGSFWYNNMDHSIEAAFRLFNEIKRSRDVQGLSESFFL